MGRPNQPSPDARSRLLDAAGRSFRCGGFGGTGVDGLAKSAGLTSGAFYAHLGSKAEAFRLAVEDGMAFLLRGVETFQAEYGDDWLGPFVEFYLGERMAVGLEEACALPTFMADVARADAATRKTYQQGLERLAAAVAKGLKGRNKEERAWRLLVTLAGAAGMARTVVSSTLKAAILAAVLETAKSA